MGEILAYQEQQAGKLEKLQDYEAYLAGLEKKAREAEALLAKACRSLSQVRKSQAAILEEAVQKGLEELNFVDVRFEIHFEELKSYTGNGTDDVEFMISLNPGQPLRPLKDVASGGELSRIMLAIRTVMARRDDIETLIFDEIDVGISGRTAQKVSEKMALIGKTHQVICITHLAQIAAMADAHYVIEKTVEEMETRTQDPQAYRGRFCPGTGKDPWRSQDHRGGAHQRQRDERTCKRDEIKGWKPGKFHILRQVSEKTPVFLFREERKNEMRKYWYRRILIMAWSL